jgi:hypothetical protein
VSVSLCEADLEAAVMVVPGRRAIIAVCNIPPPANRRLQAIDSVPRSVT